MPGVEDRAAYGTTVTPSPDEPIPESLKHFVAENTILLAAVGAMAGLSTFVGRGPGSEWAAALLQFVFTGLAFLLWLELLTQWPPELLLYRAPPPDGVPWRLVWFAYGMQLAMVGLIANGVWRQPQVLAPMLGLGAGVLFWQVMPKPVRSRPAGRIAVVVAAVLVSAAIVLVVDSPTQTMLQRFLEDARGP